MRVKSEGDLFDKKDQDIEEYSNRDGNQSAVPRVFCWQKILDSLAYDRKDKNLSTDEDQ